MSHVTSFFDGMDKLTVYSDACLTRQGLSQGRFISFSATRMNRFTHFELATNDLEKTAAFYRDVFGWKVGKWEGPVDYWLVMTGDETTPGIIIGLHQDDLKAGMG